MTDDIFSRTWQEIVARPGGPLAMRFYLQPLMATLLALRDGLADARTGQPPYFWAICFEPGCRRELIRSGWQSIAKVFCIAMALDVLYQLIVLKGFRPLQTMLVAVALAIVPYLLVRGPISRIVRTLRRRSPAAAAR
ncbi:MAG TPA: hypothetical protein VFS33_01955 [Gemmatimonadales bacterium]|nr:hypothetical protein [Gemmatimonadales bacterium]